MSICIVTNFSNRSIALNSFYCIISTLNKSVIFFIINNYFWFYRKTTSIFYISNFLNLSRCNCSFCSNIEVHRSNCNWFTIFISSCMIANSVCYNRSFTCIYIVCVFQSIIFTFSKNFIMFINNYIFLFEGINSNCFSCIICTCNICVKC